MAGEESSAWEQEGRLCVHVLSELQEKDYSDQEDSRECPLKLEQQLGKSEKTLIERFPSYDAEKWQMKP